MTVLERGDGWIKLECIKCNKSFCRPKTKDGGISDKEIKNPFCDDCFNKGGKA